MTKRNKKLILILLATIIYSGVVSAEPAPLREKLKENYTNIELKGGVKIDSEKQVVTLNLRDSDLRQVLRMLADKTGKNIIMHEGVSGTITLDLVDVELNKAIEYIMTMKELSYREDGNTLIIAKKADATSLGLHKEKIRGIKIKYIDASKIANFLNKNIFSQNRPNTSSSAIVTTNPSTNEILIFGSDEDVKLAQEVVDYLDIKPEMKSFTVKYTDPTAIASKICWTAFKSDGGEQSFSRPADLSEGSEIKVICGQTAEPVETADGDGIESFATPSYWVMADTGLNQITIYGGTTEQLNLAQEIIDNFDKREPQIYIEVSLIELNELGSKAFNHDFRAVTDTNDINYTAGSTTIGRHSGSDNVNYTSFIMGKGASHVLNGLTTNSYINIVITENKGRVLANPRLITANNTKADIDISSDNISKTETTYDADTDITTRTFTTSSDEGIKFSILPKILPSEYINLTIEPEFNSIKTQIKSGDDIIATLLNKRKISTKNVRVKDGETLVLAGLIQETETISHAKFPILSDIPIIGTFFQSQGTKKDRTELIIMITPRIIYDQDQVVESI